jgi:hypothetical protein
MASRQTASRSTWLKPANAPKPPRPRSTPKARQTKSLIALLLTSRQVRRKNQPEPSELYRLFSIDRDTQTAGLQLAP